MNQRTQLLFLIRNSYLLLCWSLTTYKNFGTPFWVNNSTNVLTRLTISFFKRGFLTLEKRVLRRWKFFMSININKSVEYWIFRKTNLFLDLRYTEPTPSALVLHNSNNRRNSYYTHFLVSNIFLHRKPGRVLLFKHLHLILNWWSQWNKSHKFALKLLIDSHEFALLYFYNMYIFKVYQL